MKEALTVNQDASVAFKALLSALFHLELSADLPDGRELWLDEDSPYLNSRTRGILEKVLWCLDPALGDRLFGGLDYDALDKLHRCGFPSYLLPGERAVIRTVKGKILVVKPF